jgi:hypothetical protein
MSGGAERFDAGWLALREPHDRAARSRVLAGAFLGLLPRGARVADLACGSGANARYLAALGRPDLRWLRLDADADLLARAGGGRRIDLARPRRSLDLGGCRGVTASALCDLVSGRWIDALIRDAARHRLPVLLALTIDGRVTLSPGDRDDGAVLSLFRRDQRRDKGFGPALGPAAPLRIAAALRRQGYRLRCARSDWRLGPADAAILDALVCGFAAVSRPGVSEAWLGRRRKQIAGRRLAASVGHVDMLASFPPQSAQASRSVNLP